jgi:hypothetical protein
VPQYGTPPNLWLVAPTYRFGNNQRWVLLTCGLVDQRAGPRQIRRGYGLRWRAEDGKRFIGQLIHAEKFLTHSFLALERMLWCVCLAGGFLALLQREEEQLCQEIAEEVIYWENAYKLPVYRLLRGLQAISTRAGNTAVLVNA